MLPLTSAAKFVAPVAFLAVGMLGAKWLNSTAPELERQQVEQSMPLVDVIPVTIQARQLDVVTHGELVPQNQVQLAAEVGGRVLWVAEQWRDGEFFAAGEPLLKIDAADYELAVASAEAQLAQAKAALQVEQAEADAALLDWQEHGEGDAPPLVAREPQLQMARANLRAAEAGVAQAKLALSRCTVIAPIDGRVLQAVAKVGQFVAPGTMLGSIYDSSRAEVRLPVLMRELAWLDLQLGDADSASELTVELRGDVGGVEQVWPATVIGSEASLDPRNRMLTVIAQVDDPFALRKSTQHAAMVPGMFLQAVMSGRNFPSVATLPRAVLREDGTVLVVTPKEQIEIRKVEGLRSEAREVQISGGLENGERVCVTPLPAVTSGMNVRIADRSAHANGEQR